MQIPKIIDRLEQPEQMIRLERYKEFQDITYPLSALEIAEMIEVPAATIRNYRAGREIPRYIFGLISKMKVRHHIAGYITRRSMPNSDKVFHTPLRKIVIKRLQRDSKTMDTELANKAIDMLKKLGVR